MSNSQRTNLKTVLLSRYRELGGLAVFLLIFYGVITWTNRASEDDSSKDVNASQMTKARLYSDVALSHADFSNAIVHLEDLLAADPHNSHARFRLADCYRNEFILMDARLNARRVGLVSDSGSNVAPSAEMMNIHQQAVEHYQRCTKSHRYRGESLLEMAKLFGRIRNRSETLAALKRRLQLRYETERGIESSPEFTFLLNDPEFQKLMALEQRQRHENRYR